jgi:LPXTG-motif cell wall-anchored protein
MGIKKRRMLQLVTALGLAGAILAGPAGIGGSHVAAQENSFAGSSTGYALRVTLDFSNSPLLPVLDPVLSALGIEDGMIDQYIIRNSSVTDGNGTHRARSALAEGLINLDAIEATAVGQSLEHTFQSLDGLPLIGGSVASGPLGSLRAAVAEGPAVAGTGVLHNLTLDLASLGLEDLIGEVLDPLEDLLMGVAEELDQVLESVLGDVLGDLLGLDGLTALVPEELSGLLDELLGGNDGVLCDVTGLLGLPCDAEDGDILGAVTDLAVAGLVEQLINALRAALTGVNGLLAEVVGLVNETGIQQLASGTAVSRSTATIESINLLGGLVDVDVFNLFSQSSADGTPGSAENASDCTIADVNIGNGLITASLDGSSLTVADVEVPLPVNEVLGLVSGLLSAIGVVDIGLCETAKVEADPDGMFAAQSVSALRVAVAPLGLFSLVIDPTVQTAVALDPTPEQPQVQPPTAEVQLPRTGAAHMVTALAGMALLGAALMARRRLVS